MASRFSTIEISDAAVAPDGFSFATVRSPSLGRRGDVLLFQTRGAADRDNVPIIILLHGVFGSHWAWAFKGAAHETAQSLVDEGVLPDCVLCMPSDGLWGDGTGYLPHHDADYAAWIVDDVPNVALEVLGSCSSSSPVYIAGLSMGGYGALRLAAEHPDRFGGAYGHSSVTSLADLRRISADWSGSTAQRSLLDAIVTCGDSMPAFGFDCGLDDALLPANRALHDELVRRGIQHEYAEHPGAHDWDYWRTHLEGALRFLSGVMAD